MTNDSTSSESNSSNSSNSSLHSAISTAPSRILRPRLAITYNVAALSQLQGKPQVRMLNCISIPLPPSCDEESPSASNHNQPVSPTAEAEANSPCSPKEESPVSTLDARPPCEEEESPTKEPQPMDSPHRPEVESPMMNRVPLTRFQKPRSGKNRRHTLNQRT